MPALRKLRRDPSRSFHLHDSVCNAPTELRFPSRLPTKTGGKADEWFAPLKRFFRGNATLVKNINVFVMIKAEHQSLWPLLLLSFSLFYVRNAGGRFISANRETRVFDTRGCRRRQDGSRDISQPTSFSDNAKKSATT